MPKSPDAFRTISEVADWLGVQAHVLRFWESKFAQVKPIKRAGGRRYYRPADMLLLGGIKKLLHDDGLTIKGAQKLLREKGVAFVADQSQPLDDLTIAVIEGDAEAIEADAEEEPAVEMETVAAAIPAETDAPEAVEETAPVAEPYRPSEQPADNLATLDTVAEMEPAAAENETETERAVDFDAADGPEPAMQDVELQPSAPAHVTPEETAVPDPAPVEVAEEAAEAPEPMPSFRARPRTAAPVPEGKAEDAPPAAAAAPVEQAAPEEDTAPAPRKPRIVDVPPVPPASDLSVSPSALSALSRLRRMSPEHAREIKPLLARLTRLRASMGNPRKDTHKD